MESQTRLMGLILKAKADLITYNSLPRIMFAFTPLIGYDSERGVKSGWEGEIRLKLDVRGQ